MAISISQDWLIMALLPLVRQDPARERAPVDRIPEFLYHRPSAQEWCNLNTRQYSLSWRTGKDMASHWTTGKRFAHRAQRLSLRKVATCVSSGIVFPMPVRPA